MTKISSGTRSRRAGFVLLSSLVLLLSSELPAFAADPSLSLARTIRTTPFADSSVSVKDHEGSTYVPTDNSLWLVDDNANAVYEVDATTGALKRMIPRAAFNSAPRFGGGGPVAGTSRTDDFESFAYDQSSDSLYLFSGPCCNTSILPTAFRLTRQSGAFQVESYQPLAGTANYTASAWNSADQMIYVGATNQLRTYHYETNIAGPAFQIPNLAAILGMGFSSDGADLFVVTNAEVLKRVDWGSRTVVPGWTFNLLPFDVRDSRGVELIGDQLYVSDGADSRPAGPLKYAVFVFDVLGDSGEPQASFTANPSSGNAPLTVTFDNTTTGDTPMTWEWDFDGDGSTDSTAENPTFVFDTPDTYTVELTATNPSGSDTTTRNVVVTDPPQPPSNLVGNPGFEVNTAGWGVTGSGTGITLARVTNPVHAGAGAARLMNGSTGTRKCVLNDVPNWVTTTQAGLYTGSIWVRGASPGAQIKVNFRELNGSSVLRSRTQTYTLTTSWQLVSVTHRPISPGTSTIDLQVFLPKAQAPPGVCFYADDASITRS